MSTHRTPFAWLARISLGIVLALTTLFACTESARDPLATEAPQATVNPNVDTGLALQRITELKAEIDALRAAGAVSARSASDLHIRLDGAVRDIRRGKLQFAMARLFELILYVKVQPTKNITNNAAAVITQRAHGIIDILKGGASNQAPVAQIVAPTHQSTFPAGTPINFAGSGSDPEDGMLSGEALLWTSSIMEEPVGVGATFSRSDLSVGTHIITLRATDSDGATGTSSVQITVLAPPNQTPTAQISAPSNQAVFPPGAPIGFAGSASDPEDGALDGEELVWTSSIGGQIGFGASFTRNNLAPGTHTITLTATDSKGATGTATVQITVQATSNQTPSAQISAPANQAVFQQGAAINFAGTGNDAEDGALTGASLVWTSNMGGQLGTGASFTLNNLAAGTHTITLTATDSNGATGTATVQITVQAALGNQAPSAQIAAPANGGIFIRLVDNITFTGSATDPEDGALTGAALVWTRPPRLAARRRRANSTSTWRMARAAVPKKWARPSHVGSAPRASLRKVSCTSSVVEIVAFASWRSWRRATRLSSA
jgi:hypothetical protein